MMPCFACKYFKAISTAMNLSRRISSDQQSDSWSSSAMNSIVFKFIYEASPTSVSKNCSLTNICLWHLFCQQQTIVLNFDVIDSHPKWFNPAQGYLYKYAADVNIFHKGFVLYVLYHSLWQADILGTRAKRSIDVMEDNCKLTISRHG